MKITKKKRNNRTERRGIYVLPNLFTSASLFSGFYSIIAAIHGEYETAAIAILVSCVFDGLDGKIARLTKATSEFGGEYDSLSDLVAFGVAPALLAFQWILEPFGRLGWLACFMYVICGALRLARFNVQRNSLEADYFKGLPIPAAAGLIASLVLFTTALGDFSGSKHIVIILLYVLSFLMVSTVDYLSFKEFELKKRRPFNVLVASILVFTVIAYKPKIMLFLILAIYILSGPLISAHLFHKRRAMARNLPEEVVPAEKH